MAGVVDGMANEKGMTLPRDVRDYLVEIIGTDTGRIDQELEKLMAYCGGPDQAVTLAAAREICQGHGEAISWTLLDSVGNRDAREALRVADVLLRQEKDPDTAVLGIVLQMAGRIRQLLRVKILMQKRALRTPEALHDCVAGLSQDAKQALYAEGYDFVFSHPYRSKILAGQAATYSGAELVQAMLTLRDANWRCVSATVTKRVILEDVLLTLMSPSKQKTRR